MSKPLIVYWSSNSGGTRRVAEALNTDTVELADYDGTSPYVLMTPTYDQPRGGFTPKPVQQFLEEHAHLMVGVAATGNLNFQEYYCQAGIDISKEHGDLAVAVVREGARFPAEELIVERTTIYDFAEEGTAVARIF